MNYFRIADNSLAITRSPSLSFFFQLRLRLDRSARVRPRRSLRLHLSPPPNHDRLKDASLVEWLSSVKAMAAARVSTSMMKSVPTIPPSSFSNGPPRRILSWCFFRWARCAGRDFSRSSPVPGLSKQRIAKYMTRSLLRAEQSGDRSRWISHGTPCNERAA